MSISLRVNRVAFTTRVVSPLARRRRTTWFVTPEAELPTQRLHNVPDCTTFGLNDGFVAVPQLGVLNFTSRVWPAGKSTFVPRDNALREQSSDLAAPCHT